MSPNPSGSKVLPYAVFDTSGHSANYRPDNVRDNLPSEQASRWSSASNDQNQFITLRLERMALIDYISFAHVCNLKEFKVFVGPDLESLRLVLHSGLNNDTDPETFPLDWSLSCSGSSENGLDSKAGHPSPTPIQFVKIVPVAAWGSNFNFSIWYVELRGNDADTVVSTALQGYRDTRERQTARRVLKYLRDGGHDDAFLALQRSTGCVLEADEVTQLWRLLQAGNLEGAEALLVSLFSQQPELFDDFLHRAVPYVAQWIRLDCGDAIGPSLGDEALNDSTQFLDENGDFRIADKLAASMQDRQPAPRGGHQMVLADDDYLYLFGGWDGRSDLGDFWRCRVPLHPFDPETEELPCRWELLAVDTSRCGGPSPRSCHKATWHAATRSIYVLGRYIEPERRSNTGSGSSNSAQGPIRNTSAAAIRNDFYAYNVDTGAWRRISEDVRSEGGPACIYDHQMAVDDIGHTIWVFGGRCLAGGGQGGGEGSSQSMYSGLYRYDIRSNTWTLIRPDSLPSQNEAISPLQIPSRIGHSMCFDPHTRSLLIMSGQRNKDYLGDFYRYDVDRDAVVELLKCLQWTGGPEPGFTQRACLDVESREMFVFSGLMKSFSNGNTAGNVGASSGRNIGDAGAANNSAGRRAGSDTSPYAVALVGNSGAPAPSSTLNSTLPEDWSYFWCYDVDTHRWTRVHASPASLSPSPRFAHQIVMHPRSRQHFLFGGNPGSAVDPSARLGDFWCVRLRKSLHPEDVLRRCKLTIRCARFRQQCRRLRLNKEGASDAVGHLQQALQYLQGPLAEVVDHANADESRSFRALAAQLFTDPLASMHVTGGGGGGSSNNTVLSIAPVMEASADEHGEGTRLFNDLVRYLPRAMQPPAGFS